MLSISLRITTYSICQKPRESSTAAPANPHFGCQRIQSSSGMTLRFQVPERILQFRPAQALPWLPSWSHSLQHSPCTTWNLPRLPEARLQLTCLAAAPKTFFNAAESKSCQNMHFSKEIGHSKNSERNHSIRYLLLLSAFMMYALTDPV